MPHPIPTVMAMLVAALLAACQAPDLARADTIARDSRGAEPVYEIHYVESVDGALIRVEILRDAAIENQGVLLTYSPYNTLGEPSPADDGLASEFNPMGIARAVADVIGTRGSTGCWDYGGVAEQQSGIDVVNYLASLPWSNGNVGMIGTSYDGTTANMVAAAAPEALKLIVAEAAISHWYGYAYRQGVRYLLNRENPSDEGFDTPLAFDLGFGRTVALDPAGEHFLDSLIARTGECGTLAHTQEAYTRSPDYGPFWQERDYTLDPSAWRAAVLLSHGWNDFNVKADEAVRLWEVLPLDNPATPELDGVRDKRLFLTQDTHSSATDYPAFVELRRDMLLAYLLDDPVARARLDADPLRVTSLGTGAERRAADFPFPGTRSLNLFLNRFFVQDLDCVPVCVPGPGTGEIGTLEPVNRFEGSEGMDTPGAWFPQASWLDVPVTTEDLSRQDPLNDGSGIAGNEALPGGHGYVSLYFETAPLEAPVEVNGSTVLRGWFQKSTPAPSGTVMPILIDVAPDGSTRTIQRGFLNLDYAAGLATAQAAAGWVSADIRFLPSHHRIEAGHKLALVVQSNNALWALPGRPAVADLAAGPPAAERRRRRAPPCRANAVRGCRIAARHRGCRARHPAPISAPGR